MNRTAKIGLFVGGIVLAIVSAWQINHTLTVMEMEDQLNEKIDMEIAKNEAYIKKADQMQKQVDNSCLNDPSFADNAYCKQLIKENIQNKARDSAEEFYNQ